jgi:hypothetical protein
LWGADAWEHHRVVLALSEDLFNAKNPTYASEQPSIRYSPYSVALAAASVALGQDTYDVLSAAAVLNMLGLIIGLRLLLGAFDELGVATYALLMIVALWVVAPGYASSTALSDLPWHEVNPSAFGFSVTLIVWAITRWIARGVLSPAWFVAIGPLFAAVFLSQAITGAVCALGLAMMLVICPSEFRRSYFIAMVASAFAAAILCFLWPWYDFRKVLVGEKLEGSWFNLAIAWRTLTVWYLPALFFAIFALPMRKRPLVAFCLMGFAACYLIGWISILLRSFALQRVCLAGVWFAQIAVAAWAADSGVLQPRTWNRRVRNLLSENMSNACMPVVEVCLTVMIVWGLATQLWVIAREPYIARAYLAPLMGKENKQLDLRRRLRDLLTIIQRHDVVLSDNITAWPVPSFGGRIVSSLHGEFFVLDEPSRNKDVETFFDADTDEKERIGIIRRNAVRWILLSRERLSAVVYRRILEPTAVVARDEPLILMDAETWVAKRQLTTRPSPGDVPQGFNKMSQPRRLSISSAKR